MTATTAVNLALLVAAVVYGRYKYDRLTDRIARLERRVNDLGGWKRPGEDGA